MTIPKDILGRAFLSAHLLTGNMRQAELAVSEAIGLWDPARESEEVLFREVIHKAVGQEAAESDGWQLPREMRNVLRLSDECRRCFVLRVLERLSSQTCARLLHLAAHEVDDYTCAALRQLAGMDVRRAQTAA